ncbi:MAG: alpha/beta hydrolase family protein [Terriglobales bacterium]
MQSPYANLILRWERRLNRVDQDRRVTPFAWGAEWLRRTPMNGVPDWPASAKPSDVLPLLRQWSARVIASSDQFFAYDPVREFTLRDDVLRFRSPVDTPWPENRDVIARWFPAAPAAAGKPRSRRAVAVVAQWNGDAQSHIGLSRMFQKYGVSALRVSMPYHDRRMPAALKRAEYTVDANIGRTIHAARQAVIDIRASLDWLQQQGYDSLGIVGTSLGSCYALLASAHDERLRVNGFNHISQYFGDVVWTGLATDHVRRSLEPFIDQPGLRDAWRAISPASYLDQFTATDRLAPKKNLLIWARYDPCFLPEFSRRVVADFRRLGLHHETHALPCGHYTIGRSPFKFADAFLLTRFLGRYL